MEAGKRYSTFLALRRTCPSRTSVRELDSVLDAATRIFIPVELTYGTQSL